MRLATLAIEIRMKYSEVLIFLLYEDPVLSSGSLRLRACPSVLFPWILGHAVFAHWFRFPFGVDLTRPHDVLNYTCNFYLNTEKEISVGVWHTLPSNQWDAARGSTSPEWFRDALGDGRPVMIFLHGNGGTRAAEHRVGLVKKLSAAGFHVFSLDYRGFGDSSGDPTEAGVTDDALYLYHWVKEHSRGSSVSLWGQSLGTGIATNTAVRLQKQDFDVEAVVLQAPFTNVREMPYIFLPGFKGLIWTVMDKIEVEFANDKNLETLTSPVLILHAEDDSVVPSYMGKQLFDISVRAHRQINKEQEVELVSYSAHLGYNHKNIYLDPNLENVVTSFFNKLKR
ncbi:hypothetical protein WMY93_016694 [Mugilogobius chulae]|uniref:AB hydrolase-1 domain-containing protein n=1 Tax=Mugilogobius chulae TaxID=88201 RepID=A0AAW0NR05_9GOBI